MYNLDTCFIKKYSSILIRPVTHLINLSVRTSKFPNNWKKAVITPVFKAGDHDLIWNYRHISILPVLSKAKEGCGSTAG